MATESTQYSHFRLQRVADALVAHFVSAGIMSREYERVKLHVTVINSLMRKDPSGSFAPARSGNKQGLQDRESFDAANILQVKYGNYFSHSPKKINIEVVGINFVCI